MMSRAKKLSLALITVLFVVISCFSALFTTAIAESVAITNSDFVGASGTESGTINESDVESTDIVLPYAAGSAVYYGEKDNACKVDMASFSWTITINSLAVGQSFTVSFIADTTKMPFDGAIGVSYVFHRVENGLNFYILDAADGSLMQEMIDTPSMWAYYKDGEFAEYPKGEDGAPEGYCGGMIGKIPGEDFSGKKLKVVNMIDGASFDGTTYRPAIDTISLGRTVPGTIFESRSIDKTQLVLVLSAGGQNGVDGDDTSDLSFTVNTPSDKATKAYKSDPARVQLITRLSSYVTASASAINGELSAEDYATMLADVENPDLSILRVRERYIQENNLAQIRANISLVNEKIAGVPQIITAYNTALTALSDINSVTAENVATAEQAKVAFDAQKAYIGYLQGEEAEQMNTIVSALDESLLIRGNLQLQVKAYESAVEQMTANATSNDAAKYIVAAQRAKSAIDSESLSLIKDTDKTAFESRISACDQKVKSATVGKAYAVEEYKIELYKNAVNGLGANATVLELQGVYKERPTLDLSGVLPVERPALESALANVDSTFGEKLANVLKGWADIYGEKVYELSNLAALSQKKIDDAIAAAYDKDDYNTICAIADGIGYDLSERKNVLLEYDRTVNAAPVRLLLVKFNTLATGDFADVAALNESYVAYMAVVDSDITLLSDVEKAAYDSMAESAISAYESKATAIINTALEAFEQAAAVDNIDELEALQTAKAARAAIPELKYLIVSTDYDAYTARYATADAKIREQVLYYVEIGGPSWTASETQTGLRLDNKLENNNNCNGVAIIGDALDIDGFDFAFEFTEIGRIWKGEDPVGSGKYPQSVYMLNIVNEKGKWKDQAQGFTIYFYCNVFNELEVMIYGAATTSENLLASGKIQDCGFTADPYVPYTVRVRITQETNSYRVWINSLQLNIYFRDILNPSEDKVTHIPGYAEGDEIGGVIFEDGKAYVSFLVSASALTAEESESAITIRMIGDKTFGDYVPPVYMVSVDLVSGPTKTTYQKGEVFDKTGIVMKATMSDGTVVDVALNSIKVLGFTSTSKGTKNVSLSYTDASGVTLTKVVKVTIVDAEEKSGKKGGCGSAIVSVSAFAAVVTIAGATLMLKKKK